MFVIPDDDRCVKIRRCYLHLYSVMSFTRYEPSEANQDIIECYWIAEDDSTEEKIEKIIPDGFPEIIFHYREPYFIKLSDDWKFQAKQLLAGQITKHFFLKNTGVTGVLGIKMKPAALTELFNLHMSEYTDKVVELHSVLQNKLNELENIACADASNEKKIEEMDNWFKTVTARRNTQIENCIAMIFERNGMVTINELTSQVFVTERQLQRLFQKYIGLSPKFYTMIIRFNYIFSLMQNKNANWTNIALDSGFYDSSHFTKNFKAFSDEDPSQYLFEEKTMANFFLQKKSM